MQRSHFYQTRVYILINIILQRFAQILYLYDSIYNSAKRPNKQKQSSCSQYYNQQYLQRTVDTFNSIEQSIHQGKNQFQDFDYNQNDFNGARDAEEYQQDDESSYSEDGDIDYEEQQDKRPERQCRNEGGKIRKIRTTITKQKLEQMNDIFKQYMEDKDKGRIPVATLKQIGNKLKLGYSTILHKFREFRHHKVVKGGALLESLQKKRKYSKSQTVQRYIQKSLHQRPFYTAVELSKYIFRRFGKIYSRSIISRHLTEMGYSFNNIKPYPMQKNATKYVQARMIFARILQKLTQKDANYVFIDQVAFSRNLFTKNFNSISIAVDQKKSNQRQQDYVSLLVVSNKDKIYFYQIKSGFFNHQDFTQAIVHLEEYIKLQQRMTRTNFKTTTILTDIHRIHFESDHVEEILGSTVSTILRRMGVRRFFLPPGSPQLNPLQSLFSTIRERLSKEGVAEPSQLRPKLEQLMRAIVKQPTGVYFKDFKLWLHKAKTGENF